MPESSREWPPHKLVGESEDMWLLRLQEEIVLEHQDWLARLALGDAEVLIEVAEDLILEGYLRSEISQDETAVLNEISDEEVHSIMMTAIANNDQHLAAVRNGDPDAVSEYAEFELATLKYHTN